MARFTLVRVFAFASHGAGERYNTAAFAGGAFGEGVQEVFAQQAVFLADMIGGMVIADDAFVGAQGNRGYFFDVIGISLNRCRGWAIEFLFFGFDRTEFSWTRFNGGIFDKKFFVVERV